MLYVEIMKTSVAHTCKEEKTILDAFKKGKMKLSSPSNRDEAIKATAKKHW